MKKQTHIRLDSDLSVARQNLNGISGRNMPVSVVEAMSSSVIATSLLVIAAALLDQVMVEDD